ncbi:sulfotransferase 1C2 [Lingula anatina]|uniref:Sulfotransferase 1C2 n=1 Tax=Lingula anatina TaxID=7574 RepID=A0A1S3H6R8_LINAN|nr:sulfotransferase 1C2 [Lingula anatina]|eukprot:XP_013381176.1 sulfotransferase 1C2 [Lingula anatina]
MSDFDVKSFTIPGQYYLDGVLLGSYNPPDGMKALREFDLFEDDCIVAAYPKSGQTWTLELVYLVLHHGTAYERENTARDMRTPWIEWGPVDEERLRNISNIPRPRVFKTHAIAKHLPVQLREKNVKMVFVFRNPKDVAVSYYHFYRMNAVLSRFPGTWSQFYEMFMAGNVAHGSWFDYVQEYWREFKDDKNVLFLYYEDMVKDHAGSVRKIANFLGRNLRDDVVEDIVKRTSFKTMKDNFATRAHKIPFFDENISPFFRKGNVGDWKNHFTVRQNEDFDRVYAEKVAESGFCIDFGE